MANMIAPTVFSAGGVLTIILLLGSAINKSQSLEESSSFEAKADDVVFQDPETEDGTSSNRVLPVDAEHNSKISFPNNPLDPTCVKMMRDNLLTFLKRVKRSEGKRKGKQDDGDDGDDGDEGIQGVINNLAEGNGALSVLSAVPAALPQLVNTLTQLSGAINQGLNGTDTPNIPSFLAKQSMDAIKFFQAISGGGQSQLLAAPRPQQQIHVQKIPGSTPERKPRPPAASANYEYPTDPDYPEEEDVKQPLEPSLKPLKPGQVAGGKYPNVEPIPGSNSNNPFLQNADLLPSGIRRPSQPTPDPNAQYIDGLPSRTSLWSIYKSFRNKGLESGSLTDFQLAHPDAFSNELLQSISHSISSNRGQAPIAIQPSTDRPASEILQQLFPNSKPAAFESPNRPTLSVYRPAVSNSGIGIELSNIAFNQTNNIIDENEQANAGNGNNEQESEEATSSPSNQEQHELEASDLEGVKNRVPGGLGSTSNFGYHHLQQTNSNNRGTPGSNNGQQQSQQLESQLNSNGNAQFVKSPTSSHLTITMGEYVPAIASLHEGDEELNKVGPQTNFADTANGFKNKAPYNKVKGVLIEAPRLTPSPYLNLKRPAGLTGNFGGITSQNPTTPTPNYSYQFLNTNQNPSSLFPPGAASYRPSDPNAPRAPTLIAAIPSNFQLSQNPLKTNGIVPSSLIPNSGNPTPETETVNVASTTEAFLSANWVSPTFPPKRESAIVEEDLAAPEDNNQGISSNNAAPTSVVTPQVSNVNPTPFNSSVSLLSLYQKFGQQPIQSQLLANTLINNNVEDSSVGTSAAPSVEPVKEVTTTKASILAFPSSSGLKFSSSLTSNQAQNQNSPLVQSLLGNLKLPQIQNPTELEHVVTAPQQGNGQEENIYINSIKTQSEVSPTSSLSTSSVNVEPQGDIASSIISSPIPARAPAEESSSTPQKVAPIVHNNQSPLASFFPFPIASQFLPSQGQPSYNQQQPQILASTTTTSTTTETTTSAVSPAVTNRYAGIPISNTNFIATGNFNFQQNSQQPSLPNFNFPSAVNPSNNGQNYNLLNNNPPTQNPGIPSKIEAKNETVLKSEPETTTLRPTSSNIIGGTYSFANLAPSPLFPSHIQNAVNANPPTGSASPGKDGPFQPLTSGNSYPSQLPSQKPFTPNHGIVPPPLPPLSPPKNSNNAQQFPVQATSFPPFANAIRYRPNQTPLQQTTTKTPVTTTAKPEIKPVNQNYNYPQSNPSGLPVSSIYSPQVPPEKVYKPLIISNTGFQGPVQNAGYPSYVPSTPVLGSSSNLQSPSTGLNAELPPSYMSPSYGGPPGVIKDVLNQAQQNRIPNKPQVLDSPQSPSGAFSETLATQNVGTSAIAEMSKLPYYQEDTFRPSALPAHLLINENEDYSLENIDAETNTKSPTISELFSSVSKVSQKVPQQTSETSTVPTSESVVSVTTPNLVSSVTPEEDSSEQEIPNFPPGKPAYWMNMYYPNGVPVLTKVSTTPNPRRRRRRTIPPQEITQGPEADSDEYDEANVKTKRKKLQT
ncbi:unnamed protein product [Orchesella dallaii]|uniref:Uncharacterized protein n=1 Tax=Orchesella dallaii TaxID=48710 RepID=A0ABP1QF34_9HEXA